MNDVASKVMCAILGHDFHMVRSSLVPYLPGALFESRHRDQNMDEKTLESYTWIACSRCGLRQPVTTLEAILNE